MLASFDFGGFFLGDIFVLNRLDLPQTFMIFVQIDVSLKVSILYSSTIRMPFRISWLYLFSVEFSVIILFYIFIHCRLSLMQRSYSSLDLYL